MWVFVILSFTTPTVGLLWGWIRWFRCGPQRDIFAVFSLVGFVLATSSALLLVSTLIYAHSIGGFPFYDPLLLRLYRWGGILSGTGLGTALVGIWGKNALRWHAPVLSVGMCWLWMAMAMGE